MLRRSWNIIPDTKFPPLQNRHRFFLLAAFLQIISINLLPEAKRHPHMLLPLIKRVVETSSSRAGQQDSGSAGAVATRLCQAVSDSRGAFDQLVSQGIWVVGLAGSLPQSNLLSPSLKKSCPGGESRREPMRSRELHQCWQLVRATQRLGSPTRAVEQTGS